MSDQRDECGCHKSCTTLSHKCDKPCIWPGCLTRDEQLELADEIANELGF